MGAPQEPWAESLKVLMLIFGAALLACFVLPWMLAPKVGFSWDVINASQGKAKLQPLLIAGSGLLAVVLALLPLTVLARGVAAAALGFAPVALVALVVAKVEWQSLVLLASSLTLVSGLLVRSEYHSSIVPRAMVTIGVLCLFIPLLLPKPELIELLKAVAKAPGKAKVAAILTLVPYLLALISLVLAWLPSSGSMGTHIMAWMLLVWPLVASLATNLALAGDGVSARVKADMVGIFWSPITAIAWAVLIGYGIASTAGKSLEHN
jgi:hypothetical protein